jgi:hypothetical protein
LNPVTVLSASSTQPSFGASSLEAESRCWEEERCASATKRRGGAKQKLKHCIQVVRCISEIRGAGHMIKHTRVIEEAGRKGGVARVQEKYMLCS